MGRKLTYEEVKECGIDKVEEITKNEISVEVQEVIDYILKNEPDINFKICSKCGRNLPMHDWFYKIIKGKNKNRYNSICKECTSIMYDSGLYKFYNMLNKQWYYYKLEEIKTLSRVMSDKQLSDYFNRNIYDIEHVLYNTLKTNKNERIDNLNKEEIIQIYTYLLNKDREAMPKGFFNNEYYIEVLLEYLIIDILKWDRNKFINNFNSNILNQYGLFSIRKTRDLSKIISIVNKILNWDIKLWELRKSNTGIGFWLDINNVNEVLSLFKDKLKMDKNINNIYDAYQYGLAKLISEYHLIGLLKYKYNNSCFDLFEYVYNIKFDINYFNDNYYSFEINVIPCSLNYNGIIYKLTDKYYKLDDIRKTLINDIIKYCETNKKFPTNSNLKVEQGYISYIYIQKYFKKYSNIFSYILPLQDSVNNCWNKKENRINYIKYYCEEKCDENILHVINSTELLKIWTSKYFNHHIINKEMYWANDYVPQIYNLLIEAYPNIKNNRILFDWEWQSFYPIDNNRRIEMLRELILYRLNDTIINPIDDIPKYLNFLFIDNSPYRKFSDMIRKGKFKNYYEWACLSFPEYQDIWTPQMFGNSVAYDGTICDSKEEMMVYEFIKKEMNYNYFKHIGRKKSGEYTFKLKNNDYNYKTFCPDFVLEYIDFENIKFKLEKPLYIEYYGLYHPNNTDPIYVNYCNKTNVKNVFYKSNQNINFIDLYPNDLKNNFQKVKDKLNFVLENSYNISV